MTHTSSDTLERGVGVTFMGYIGTESPRSNYEKGLRGGRSNIAEIDCRESVGKKKAPFVWDRVRLWG